MNRSLKTIQIILRYVPYLDAEFLSLISKIDDCNFFSLINALSSQNLRCSKSNMTFLSNNLYTYYDLTIQLSKYLERNHKNLAWSERRS